MTLSESEKRDISPAKLALSTNSQLPEGWIQKPLKEVAEIAFSGVNKKSRSDQKTVRLCNYMDVYNNDYITADIDFMTATASDREIERFTLQQGDVIITKDSETPDDIGVPAVVVDDLDNVICGYHLALLRPKQNEIDGIFFAKELARDRVSNQFSRVANGATRFGLTLDAVRNVKVNVPPLPEQKKIARILGTWDQAIDLTERLIKAKEKRFKWLLKTLISDQQDNPEWRKVKLVDACEVIVSPVDKKTVDGELPVKLCNYTDVYYNNAIDSKINFMAATAKPREIEKFAIITDDVIITKDSETPDDIGVPAYVKETIDDLLCGYHLTILRPKKQTIGKYMCYALTSPRVKYDFYRFANGITRFGLTKESYQKIKIPLPLFPEQKRIANILDTAKEEVEFLNQLAEQYRTQKRGLMQKLLTGKVRV